MENIIIVSFDVESEAYQAMTELRKNALNENYVVSQAVLAKNNDGKASYHRHSFHCDWDQLVKPCKFSHSSHRFYDRFVLCLGSIG